MMYKYGNSQFYDRIPVLRIEYVCIYFKICKIYIFSLRYSPQLTLSVKN